MNDRDILGEFRDAHNATIPHLKDFLLFKNLSGKIHWILLLSFTVFMIIATGSFQVLVFSSLLAVLMPFCYYCTILSEQIRARSQSEKNNDSSSVRQKDR